MTDPDRSSTTPPADDPVGPDPSTDPDALVSAVLDGEATPDEAARVQGDAALSARLTEMREVRAALAGTAAPRLSDAARSRLLATALAVARDSDDRRDEPGPGDVAVVPTPLPRSRRSPRTALIVGAAAATIALIVALALFGSDRTSNESSSAGGTDAATSAEAGSIPPAPSTTTTPTVGSAENPSDDAARTALANLGTFPDIATLANAAVAVTPGASPPLPLSAVVACPGELDRAGLAGATTLGRALVGGQSVVVGRAATNNVAIVVSTCAVLPLS